MRSLAALVTAGVAFGPPLALAALTKEAAMTDTYRELVVGGVFIAPIVSYRSDSAPLCIHCCSVRCCAPVKTCTNFFSGPSLSSRLCLYVSMFGLLALLF